MREKRDHDYMGRNVWDRKNFKRRISITVEMVRTKSEDENEVFFTKEIKDETRKAAKEFMDKVDEIINR